MHKNLDDSYRGPSDKIEFPGQNPGPDLNLSIQSTFRMSKEQHRQVLSFVDDRIKALKDVMYLQYDNLLMNNKEDEKLQIIMNDLKAIVRDIQNCADDLRAFPFPEDDVFYRMIETKCRCCAQSQFEYAMYKKNIKSYKDVRESTMMNLKRCDETVTVHRVVQYIPAALQSSPIFVSDDPKPVYNEGNSQIFVPEESMQELTQREKEDVLILPVDGVGTQSQSPSKSQKSEVNLPNSPKQTLVSQKTERMDHVIIPRKGSMVQTLEKLKENLERCEQKYQGLNERYSKLSGQVDVIRRLKNSAGQKQEANGADKIVKSFERECSESKGQVEGLLLEFKDLGERTKQAHETYQYQENGLRIKQLDMQIQDRKDDMEQLDGKFKKIFEEFLSEETTATLSENIQRVPGWNSIYSPSQRKESDLSQIKLDFREGRVSENAENIEDGQSTIKLYQFKEFSASKGFTDDRRMSSESPFSNRGSTAVGTENGNRASSSMKKLDHIPMSESRFS